MYNTRWSWAIFLGRAASLKEYTSVCFQLIYTCVALGLLLVLGCTQDQQLPPQPSSDFPDVGLGCLAERVGPDEWRVVCPETNDSQAGALDEGITDTLPPSDVWIPEDASGGEVDARPQADLGPMPCDPSLEINLGRSAISPYELTRIDVSGGTGSWQFELVENRSGALLNETTGTYLAGDTVDVMDRIRVTDLGCIGQAEAELRVVRPMITVPDNPVLEPNDEIEFDAQFGSGIYALDIVSNRSGGSLVDGLRYRAGRASGVDILKVIDLGTLDEKTIVLRVEDEVILSVSPQVTYIPEGVFGRVEISGGSGLYRFETQDGLDWDGERFNGALPGAYSVTAHDQFGQRQTRFTVVVMKSLEAESNPINDHTLSERVIQTGDLNGDGVSDFVVAKAESDVEAYNGGEIALFLSNEGQFGPEPSQTITSENREDELGRGITISDVDGDGRPDLIYGVRYADANGRNSGSVMIHLGEANGLFAAEPSTTINGTNVDLEFGFSLTACDFNGDGYMDIAVGARAYEDRNEQPVQWDHGAVVIHLGHQDGYLHTPDQIVPGRLPDANGQWQLLRSMHLGYSIASGDFDDDGLCDIAVSSLSWVDSNQGHVFLHRGRRGSGLDFGGVDVMPSLWITSDLAVNTNPEFGRRIAMGDIDGDNKSDLVIGHFAADLNGLVNTGAAHIYRGRDIPPGDQPQVLSSADADWTQAGSAYDHFGFEVVVADADGQPPADLLVGAIYADADNIWDRGSISVFPGRIGDLPDSEPTVTIMGLENQYRLGVGIAPLGDTNGDDRPDFAAVTHYGGTDFLHVGRPFHLESAADDSYQFHPLDMGIEPGGAFFGSGVALIGDVNGDGFGDALVAAANATHPDIGIRSGEAWFYAGRARGDFEAGRRIDAFLGHTGWDILSQVASIGDFDGDGFDDFALHLNNDDRPNELNDRYIEVGQCGPRQNDQGGTYIFLGGPEKFDLEPDFVYWGLGLNDAPETLVGGHDFNGDGRADLAIGSWRRDVDGRNDAGSVAMVTGRVDPHPEHLTVICEPSYEYYGESNATHLGFSLTFIDDLNADGCDEIAVGGRTDATDGFPYAGSVHIIYGFGESPCPSGPEVTKIAAPIPWMQVGSSLAAGDLDNDGLSDLAIGAPYARFDNQTTGGVYIISGSFLVSLERQAPNNLISQWPEPGPLNRFIPGLFEGSETGRGLFIADSLIGVGTSKDFIDDRAPVSTFRVYQFDADGELNPEPKGLIIGELDRPGSLLGERNSNSISPDKRAMILGATRGGGIGRDNGSAYWVDLAPLLTD